MRRTALLALLLAGAAAAQPAPSLVSFGAEGGDFAATLSDGRSLRGADLIGATLNLTQNGSPWRCASTPPSLTPGTAMSGSLPSPPPPPTAAGRITACPTPMAAPSPSPTRNPSASASPARRARWANASASATAPGRRSPDGEVSLAPFHAACVNMVRAAYAGPQHAFTRNGMRIDLYDRIGIQSPENAPTQAFEAGWTAAGAVCVAHPRVPENGGLAEIAAEAPGLPIGAGCTEAEAQARGALLFNRSNPPG